MRRIGNHDVLRQVLDYLVRLTEPLGALPGWWCRNEPEPDQPPNGGHANFGMAHGITGPLALLAFAHRDGITVNGHTTALARICRWLDAWQQDPEGVTWWPQTLTRTELHAGSTVQQTPLRPSWCYKPGVARAQQLAALAVGDRRRRRLAEEAMLRCVGDIDQLARVTDSGLCHGAAGLYQTIWRAAADAGSPELAARLPHLAALLASFPSDDGHGFLTGDAGRGLATRIAAGHPGITDWDTSLLLH